VWSTNTAPPTHNRLATGVLVSRQDFRSCRRPAAGGRRGGGGLAAEQDGSTWRAQPPARSGRWMQRRITFEQQSTASALLGRRLVVGQWFLGGGLGVRGDFAAQDGIRSGGHDASCGRVVRHRTCRAGGKFRRRRRGCPHHVGNRPGRWRVVMSVGGPCPHEAVQAEGHDEDDCEDQEFHGRSLLPRVWPTNDRTTPGPVRDRIP
jgi:hypothetical protein